MQALTEQQMRVYLQIVHVAAEGKVLPNTRRLARLAKVGEGGLDTILCALQRKGYIDVVKRGAGRRVVKVVATGQSTGKPPVTPAPRKPNGRGPQRDRSDDSPVRAMVRATFAEFERTVPYRRALVATSGNTVANLEAKLADPIDRPTGTNCIKCGAAGECHHRERQATVIPTARLVPGLRHSGGEGA